MAAVGVITVKDDKLAKCDSPDQHFSLKHHNNISKGYTSKRQIKTLPKTDEIRFLDEDHDIPVIEYKMKRTLTKNI